MSELGNNATEALEALCILAKNAKGKAAVDVVLQAVSSPQIFVFGELLDVSSIQELDQGEHSQAKRLLEIFAYGTFQDYQQNRDQLPAVPDSALRKLKQLTVLTVARTKRTLRYDQLLELLDTPNVRELEDLIIDAMYNGLLTGKLDQRSGELTISSVIGRDVAPGQVKDMLETIVQWEERSQELLAAMGDKMTYISQAAQERDAAQTAFQAEKSKMTKKLRSSQLDGDKMDTEFISEEYALERRNVRSSRNRRPKEKETPAGRA